MTYGYKDLRSPAVIAADEARRNREAEEREQAEKDRARLTREAWGEPKWLPIESCPFKAYKYEVIYVTDGKAVALAKVKERFGRPMRLKEGSTGGVEMRLTDSGPMLVSLGEYEEIDAPEWWFKWEFEDVNGLMNYAGGEETGKDEVDFIATHWLPTPFPL